MQPMQGKNLPNWGGSCRSAPRPASARVLYKLQTRLRELETGAKGHGRGLCGARAPPPGFVQVARSDRERGAKHPR
jgi:hypothetical protein